MRPIGENGYREINQIVIDCCKQTFCKEHQSKCFPEREYIGDSWLTNLYVIYLNDYIRFDTFFENEIEELICENIDDGANGFCNMCKNRVSDLISLFANTVKFLRSVSMEEVGLRLERLLADGMPRE